MLIFNSLNTVFCFIFNFIFIFWFTANLHCAVLTLADNVEAALRSWGCNRTPFGLQLTVKGRTKVWVITPPPNFAKPLVM